MTLNEPPKLTELVPGRNVLQERSMTTNRRPPYGPYSHLIPEPDASAGIRHNLERGRCPCKPQKRTLQMFGSSHVAEPVNGTREGTFVTFWAHNSKAKP